MKVYLSVLSQWQSIANTHANVSLYALNFTVLLHVKLFLLINNDGVCEKNVTKAHALLYTAVHGLPFSCT